jgi:hypothetical protein
VERGFKTIKAGDLDVRPIRHYLAGGVEAYLLSGMLAAYLTRHPREAVAPLTFTEENIPEPAGPVAPAIRSPRAAAKDAVQQTPACRRCTVTAICSDTWPRPIGRSSVSPGRRPRSSPPRPRSSPAAVYLLGSAIPVRITWPEATPGNHRVLAGQSPKSILETQP